jgi:hypothetical protein
MQDERVALVTGANSPFRLAGDVRRSGLRWFERAKARTAGMAPTGPGLIADLEQMWHSESSTAAYPRHH